MTPTRKIDLQGWLWFLLSICFIIVLVMMPGLMLYAASALVTRRWGTFNSFVLDVLFSWALWYVTRILLRRIR